MRFTDAPVSGPDGDRLVETFFTDLNGRSTSGLATYVQRVDYLYFIADQAITTAETKNRVTAYRTAGTSHVDTVGTGGACPTSSPTPTPTVSPTVPPTPTPTNPVGCAGVPAWNWGTVYLGGQRVRHVGKLWQANWWTQGSEPGLTAQWREIGRC